MSPAVVHLSTHHWALSKWALLSFTSVHTTEPFLSEPCCRSHQYTPLNPFQVTSCTTFRESERDTGQTRLYNVLRVTCYFLYLWSKTRWHFFKKTTTTWQWWRTMIVEATCHRNYPITGTNLSSQPPYNWNQPVIATALWLEPTCHRNRPITGTNLSSQLPYNLWCSFYHHCYFKSYLVHLFQ